MWAGNGESQNGAASYVSFFMYSGNVICVLSLCVVHHCERVCVLGAQTQRRYVSVSSLVGLDPPNISPFEPARSRAQSDG